MTEPKINIVELGHGYRLVDGDGSGVYWALTPFDPDYPVGPDGREIDERDPYLQEMLKKLHLSTFKIQTTDSLSRYIKLINSRDDSFAGCLPSARQPKVTNEESVDEKGDAECKTPHVCYAQFVEYMDAAARVEVDTSEASPFVREMVTYLGENSYMVYLDYFGEWSARNADFATLDAHISMALAEANKFDKVIPKWQIDSLYVKAHRKAALDSEQKALYFLNERSAQKLEEMDKYIDEAKSHLEWIKANSPSSEMINIKYVESEIARLDAVKRDAHSNRK